MNWKDPIPEVATPAVAEAVTVGEPWKISVLPPVINILPPDAETVVQCVADAETRPAEESPPSDPCVTPSPSSVLDPTVTIPLDGAAEM